MADETERRGWNLEGGAKSSQADSSERRNWMGRLPVGGLACRRECWPTLGSDSHIRCFVDVGVGQVRSRVELFEDTRRDQRREDLSIRELASRHGGIGGPCGRR